MKFLHVSNMDNFGVLNLDMPIFMCSCTFPKARWVLALQGYTDLHAGGPGMREERFEWCLEFPFRVLYSHSCPFTFIGYDDDDDDDDDDDNDDFGYSNWNSQSISFEGLQMPWQTNCGPRSRLHILTPSTLQGGVQMNAISRTAALGLQDQWPIAVELFAELRRQSLVEGEFMCNSLEISCNNLNL